MNKKGNTIIEMIMVIILLTFFSLTVYQLIDSGSRTQEKILDRKSAQIDARIAVSFINVKLRQNDEKNKIAIKRLENNNREAIVIQERSKDYDYDTWIYFLNGNLYECVVEKGNQPNELSSSLIVSIDDCRLNFDKERNTIETIIDYTYGDSAASLSSIVHLRSTQGEEREE